MRDFFDSILKSSDLQSIRASLTDEQRYNDEDKTYSEKLQKEAEPMLKRLEETYSDSTERDVAYTEIVNVITAHEDTYFEMGMKCGARMLYQLLIENQPN